MTSDAVNPLYVALTADVDADANRAVRGRIDAVSAGAGEQRARYDACFKGLHQLATALGDLGLPATLFWEGRALEALAECDPEMARRLAADEALEHACHGYAHEDFAGTETGLPLDEEASAGVLQRAGQAMHTVLGVRPAGFRAPYCRLTPELARALAQAGYAYDASATRRPSGGWRLRPYRLPEAPALWELALCRGRDGAGRTISTYLWQMFEGNRPSSDYLELIARLSTTCPDGLLQVALHPWHLVVGADGLPLQRGGIDRPIEQLRGLLTDLVNAPRIAFTTVGRYLADACTGDL